ncbi:MAG TPA: hypothetical protein VI999_03590 [Thermoplasmata archaeon]|nr:hypothetical protein [Thermoplasmata archaeon]
MPIATATPPNPLKKPAPRRGLRKVLFVTLVLALLVVGVSWLVAQPWLDDTLKARNTKTLLAFFVVGGSLFIAGFSLRDVAGRIAQRAQSRPPPKPKEAGHGR